MTGLSRRARLYDRLPVTEDAAWWVELAAAAPGGRVLELGCGTGRLTLPLARVAAVTAVDHDSTAIARLRQRVATEAPPHPVVAVEADVAALDLGEHFGAVLLPVSLLNEIPDEDARAATIARAAAHLRPDGCVAFGLLNPLWLLGQGESYGVIEGVDGSRVDLVAEHVAVDAWSQRARARLQYDFPDGQRLVDELDAAAVFPAELRGMLAAHGLAVTEAWGSVPGQPPRHDDGGWLVVARPAAATGR